MKTYIKTAPTCFRLQSSRGSLHLSLASHIYKIVINNTSLWIMQWCRSMLYQVHGVYCADRVSLCTAHSTHTSMDLI